jgi:hypothetical protein
VENGDLQGTTVSVLPSQRASLHRLDWLFSDMEHGSACTSGNDNEGQLADHARFCFLQHADVQQKKQLDNLRAKFVQDFDSFLSQCDVVSTLHLHLGRLARYCSRPRYLTASAEAAHQADLSTLAHVGDCPLLCTAQVAINMPLTSNTRNLFNSATLSKMKKGAVLVCHFGGTPARASCFISFATMQLRNVTLCSQAVMQ